MLKFQELTIILLESEHILPVYMIKAKLAFKTMNKWLSKQLASIWVSMVLNKYSSSFFHVPPQLSGESKLFLFSLFT